MATTWSSGATWSSSMTWDGTETTVSYPYRTGVVSKVEIEFTTSTWTDVTASVRQTNAFTITGGRSDVDQRVEPGRLSGLVLKNDAGHFTVGNTAGDYYPDVVSGKRIRVSIKDPATSTYYTRFTGYIDGWPLRWEAGHCYVTLSATDALSKLLEPIDPDLWVTSVVADSGAVYYWPMTDDRQDKAHIEVSGGPALVAGSATTAPTETGPPGCPSLLPVTTETAGHYWTASNLPGDTGDVWSCAVLFKSTSPNTGDFIYVTGGDPTYGVYATTTADGYIRFGVVGLGEYGSSAVNICDGRWWMVSLSANNSGGGGVAAVATLCDDPSVWTQSTGAVGTTTTRCQTGTNTMRVGYSDCTIGHAQWIPGGTWLSGAFDTAEALMGLPDEAVTAAAWGTTFDALSPFPVTCTVPSGRGSSLYRRPFSGTWLDLWRHAEDVDGGVTYAERDGTVVYLSGAYATTPEDGTNAVIGLDLDATTVSSLEVAADRLKMVNDATATLKRVGESGDQIVATLHLTDAASIAASGTRAATLDAYGTRTSGVVDVAGDLLEPTEVPRVPQVEVNALTLPATAQQDILFGNYDGSGVGMWSLIGITDLPSTGGFPTQWLGRVEGWTETIGARDWKITFNTSFAGNRVGDTTWAKVGTMRLG